MEQKREKTHQNIVESSKQSIVFLKGKKFGLTTRVGISFFVEPDKIATNIHVISLPIVKYKVVTAKQYEIEKTPIHNRVYEAMKKLLLRRYPKHLRMQENRVPELSRNCDETAIYTIEGVAACDDKNDLVILKVAEIGVPLPLGNSNELQRGDPVSIVGYKDKKYKGIIGNILSGHNSDYQLLIKAKISPKDCEGLSGGPVLNNKGEVIGVVVAGGRLPSDTDIDIYSMVGAIPLTVLSGLVANPGQIEPFMEWRNRPRVRAYSKGKLGNWKYAAGKHKKAIIRYDDALRRNPDLANVYYNRGNAKECLGDTKGAIEDYDMAIQLNPEFANTYCNRGNAKDDLGDTKGAIEDYDMAIRLNPEHAYAYYNRGNAKDDLGDTKSAIDDYDNAICHDPENAEAYTNRGKGKKALGQHEEAEADFAKAKELNSKKK